MVKPRSVQTWGNDLLVILEDGTRWRAIQSTGELWLVSSSDAPTPPPPPPPPESGSRFVWPFPLSQVSSEYGQRRGRLHAGIDFSGGGQSNVTGFPIPAASNGKVEKAQYHSGWGNYVLLNHGQGLFTLYAHMHPGTMAVSVGQNVTQGQKLGGIGNTGNSFGNHLHFECHEGGFRYNASSRNPRVFIPKWNK